MASSEAAGEPSREAPAVGQSSPTAANASGMLDGETSTKGFPDVTATPVTSNITYAGKQSSTMDDTDDGGLKSSATDQESFKAPVSAKDSMRTSAVDNAAKTRSASKTSPRDTKTAGSKAGSEELGGWPIPADCALLVTALIHLLLCPYTKVEESFNMQAIHDILYLRTDIGQYDHLEFPGVVPRTFVGPLVVAGLSAPFVAVASLLADKTVSQLIVRLVLGCLSVAAFGRFRSAVERQLGRQVAVWLLCISVSQFHFAFYLTRTLPNMMTVPLVLMAVACWMDREHAGFIWWSAAAIILFRVELAGLLGVMLLMELASRRLSLLRCLRLCIPAGLSLLLLTVAVDSLFWRRLVWPEGEVLWFNVVLNKSSEWGVSPPLWYWYSALPRALLSSAALVPVGLAVDWRVRRLSAPPLLFVAAYSLLPHKELRFIIYVVPLLNVAAARACDAVWQWLGSSSGWRQFLVTAVSCHLLLNGALTALLLAVSRHNYPGGAALARLHRLQPAPADVHLDVYSAQTGITRFQQYRADWSYNKTESLKAGSVEMLSFSHLLVEARSRRAVALQPYQRTHTVLDSVEAFAQLEFNYGRWPPVRIRCRPAIYILENNVRPAHTGTVGAPPAQQSWAAEDAQIMKDGGVMTGSRHTYAEEPTDNEDNEDITDDTAVQDEEGDKDFSRSTTTS